MATHAWVRHGTGAAPAARWVGEVMQACNPRFSTETGDPWSFAKSAEITHTHALITDKCTYCLAAKEYFDAAKGKEKAIGTIAVCQRWRSVLVFEALREEGPDDDVHYLVSWHGLADFAEEWQAKRRGKVD